MALLHAPGQTIAAGPLEMRSAREGAKPPAYSAARPHVILNEPVKTRPPTVVDNPCGR